MSEYVSKYDSGLLVIEHREYVKLAKEIERLRAALRFAAAALVEGCDKSKDEALRHIAKLDGCVQKIEQPPNERPSDE